MLCRGLYWFGPEDIVIHAIRRSYLSGSIFRYENVDECVVCCLEFILTRVMSVLIYHPARFIPSASIESIIGANMALSCSSSSGIIRR